MRNFSPKQKFRDDGEYVTETSFECFLRNWWARVFSLYPGQIERSLGLTDPEEDEALDEFFSRSKDALPPSEQELLGCTSLVKQEEKGAVESSKIDRFNEMCLRYEGIALIIEWLVTLAFFPWWVFPIAYTLALAGVYIHEKMQFRDL